MRKLKMMKVVVSYSMGQRYPWDGEGTRRGRASEFEELGRISNYRRSTPQANSAYQLTSPWISFVPVVMRASHLRKLFSTILMLTALAVSQTWSDWQARSLQRHTRSQSLLLFFVDLKTPMSEGNIILHLVSSPEKEVKLSSTI